MSVPDQLSFSKDLGAMRVNEAPPYELLILARFVAYRPSTLLADNLTAYLTVEAPGVEPQVIASQNVTWEESAENILPDGGMVYYFRLTEVYSVKAPFPAGIHKLKVQVYQPVVPYVEGEEPDKLVLEAEHPIAILPALELSDEEEEEEEL